MLQHLVIRLGRFSERFWQPIAMDEGSIAIKSGWHVITYEIAPDARTTPMLRVLSSAERMQDIRLDNSNGGSNRRLVYLPKGRLAAHSCSMQLTSMVRIGVFEARMRISLICLRYLIDFFRPSVLLSMLVMQFRSAPRISDQLMQFYAPQRYVYLRNVERWRHLKYFAPLLKWYYRGVKVAVLIETEDQRAQLDQQLVAADVVLNKQNANSISESYDYLLILNRHENLRDSAILIFKRSILAANKSVPLVYCDHDYARDQDEAPDHNLPALKPDANLPYLHCYNYIAPLVMFAKVALGQMKISELLSEEHRYFRALQLIDDALHIDEALCWSDRDDEPSTPHANTLETPWADIEWHPGENGNHLRASSIWDTYPSVELIVPTRDGLKVLEPCIESLLDKTDYPNYRILIVDNGSERVETLEYLQQVQQHSNIRVLNYPHAFNYSAINNFAVAACDADFIGLVNNDIEVIGADWLLQLMVWAKQKGIGAVGPKLYFSDGRIQHAGVVVGLGNAAGHPHRFERGDSPGYLNRLVATQKTSAVSAACMITPRRLYLELGGLDEQQFAVAYNDIDYCLRVRERGLDIIFTPEAELFHHESVSRGDDMSDRHISRYLSELKNLNDKWRTKGYRDPFYNKHLRVGDEAVYPQISTVSSEEFVYLDE